MGRDDRISGEPHVGVRSPAQRDRDRLLYSSAFRRLNGVTQVVLPGGEPYLFHNRLVHSLKVAQVARRLAERFQQELPQKKLAAMRGGGCDPDVVESASLAHDLGHPPFGHIAEQELDRCVVLAGDADGFEGNAQTLRIVTRLAAIGGDRSGLDLTRATLAASLKYPWFRGEGPTPKKWGAYHADADGFAWAITGMAPTQRSIEADIMDQADDISYAVHDLEDFYRAGLIPLDRIVSGVESLEPVYDRVRKNWPGHLDPNAPTDGSLDRARKLIAAFPLDQPFRGTRKERSALRSFTSGLVNRFVTSIRLSAGSFQVERGALVLTELAKQLTWHYVIDGAPLATQQVGQRRIIRQLFRAYHQAMRGGAVNVLPTRWRDEAEAAAGGDPLAIPRFVADVIAGMTEEEAIRVCHRLTGVLPRDFMDPVVV